MAQRDGAASEVSSKKYREPETQSAEYSVLLAPSCRGGVMQLGETQSAGTNPRRPVLWALRPADPPGLGLSSPQPDPNRLANRVRFLAPRSWACG